MSDFNKLCKEVESLDPATFADIITEKSKKIIAGVSVITLSGMDGVTIYLHFIIAAIASDGKLAPEEYEAVRPLIEILFGREVTYEEAKQMFKDLGLDKPKEYLDDVDLMADLLGLVSEDLKDDILLVTLLICSIDGKISRKEKKWVKKLAA